MWKGGRGGPGEGESREGEGASEKDQHFEEHDDSIQTIIITVVTMCSTHPTRCFSYIIAIVTMCSDHLTRCLSINHYCCSDHVFEPPSSLSLMSPGKRSKTKRQVPRSLTVDVHPVLRRLNANINIIPRSHVLRILAPLPRSGATHRPRISVVRIICSSACDRFVPLQAPPASVPTQSVESTT